MLANGVDRTFVSHSCPLCILHTSLTSEMDCNLFGDNMNFISWRCAITAPQQLQNSDLDPASKQRRIKTLIKLYNHLHGYMLLIICIVHHVVTLHAITWPRHITMRMIACLQGYKATPCMYVVERMRLKKKNQNQKLESAIVGLSTTTRMLSVFNQDVLILVHLYKI